MVDTDFVTQVSKEQIIQTHFRFGLMHGQFFAENIYKNLFWVLDGKTIGYGDLRAQDLTLILDNLKPGEVFEGFNEHHGSQWQQTPHAMVKIADGVISFPNHESRGLIARRQGDRYIFEKREEVNGRS